MPAALSSWFRREADRGWVALAPEGDRVRAVHVVHEPACRPALRWACTGSWAEPALALRALRRARRLRREPSVLLLRHGQYRLQVLDAPEDVPREQWRDALRWRLKDTVDFAVEGAGIDLLDIAPDPQGRRRSSVLAVAAARPVLEPLVCAGRDAGWPWQAIDVPESALRNLCLLCAEPGRGQALLHVGSALGTLVITVGTDLLVTRDIDLGLDRLAGADASARRAHHERVGLELQRTLDNIERQHGHVDLARLQVAPGAPLHDFIDYLGQLVDVPVTAFELGAVLDLSAVPELGDAAEQAGYLPAVGAALRGLEGA
ncbi:hypothetical protein HLB44_29355 [Aquincola sp. S2]|uniref:MSHA biogenesis protein MshI n=1 Tax=Pseudaquabacterium terrae TaxID=2732868 RepID=A0ABX2ERH2_9BURK|nr:hypothetical protein [Aquabacterium terrae]NRF71111.1 hypothetical protein [Aquabacterium terrae]